MKYIAAQIVLGLSLLSMGCNNWQRTAEAYREINPTTFAIVVPADESKNSGVQEFVAWKRHQGFEVSVVTFYTDIPIQDQYASIGSELDRIATGAPDTGYLLILADDADLAMVEWEIAEGGDLIHSDLPLALSDRPIPGEPLSDRQWAPFMEEHPRWLPGRIPLKGSALQRVLRETIAFQKRQMPDTPAALLGAETIFLPGDAAAVLREVRGVMEASGWDAELISDSFGADGQVDDVTMTRWCDNCQVDHVDPIGLVDRWARQSPELVYLIAHSSDLEAKTKEGDEVSLVGTGRSLLSPDAWLRYHDGDGDGPDHVRRAPARPAILVSTGCSMGEPENRMIDLLFQRGWMVAFIGATENVGPAPLTPAINSEINGARFIAQGMPLGLAVHLVRRIYVEQSRSDLGLLIPGSRLFWRRNQLSFQVFGDPSMHLSARLH